MIRHPHTATIEVTTETDNGSGITGSSKTTFTISGRYEPAGQRNSVDQAAKFFCHVDPRYDNGALSGQRMYVNDSWIGISQAYNYQHHAEIWLD